MGLGGVGRAGLQGSSVRVYFVQVPLSVEYLGNRYFIGRDPFAFSFELFDYFPFYTFSFGNP